MNIEQQKPLNTCHVCGSFAWFFLYESRDLLHDLDGLFSLWECQYCGLVQTSPQLVGKEIEVYYPDDYVAYSKPPSEEKNIIARWDRDNGVRRRCEFAIENTGKNSGRVLDVGCASGNFLKGMQVRGWEAYGIEPSEFAADYARRVLDLDVRHGYLRHGMFKDDFFDLVMLWDVFEHLEDPDSTLDVIFSILKPGGSLLLSLPNSDSWDRKFFKDSWVGWDPPRHYYTYNPRLLTWLVERHGFKTFKLKSFTGRHGSAALSWDYYLKNKGKDKSYRHCFQKFFLSYFFRALSYPYYMLADALNRSANMTMVFKKKDRI
jgi:SAM-dependent methyltransferase